MENLSESYSLLNVIECKFSSEMSDEGFVQEYS